MRNLLLSAALFATLFSAQAQESETRAIGSFRGIKSGSAIDVYLKKGDKESVKVEATGVPLAAVITEVSGTYLKVQMDRGEWHGKRTVKVYVTYTELEKLSASSASNIFSIGVINGDQMEISAYSAASVEVSIKANAVNVEAASAGDVVLEGSTSLLTAETSSAGKVDAYKLEAETATVSTSSAGEAKVSVTKSLVANASSAGSIHYRGNPSKIMTNANSGGSVKKSN